MSRFAFWALVLGLMFAGSGSALDNTIPAESFRITFGLKDAAERASHGWVVPAAGQMLSIEPNHFRVHNYTVSKNSAFPRITSTTIWKCSTRAA